MVPEKRGLTRYRSERLYFRHSHLPYLVLVYRACCLLSHFLVTLGQQRNPSISDVRWTLDWSGIETSFGRFN